MQGIVRLCHLLVHVIVPTHEPLQEMMFSGIQGQARSSLYANTQLRAHRRAEETKIKSKKKIKNK
jgi:hypothetical protein